MQRCLATLLDDLQVKWKSPVVGKACFLNGSQQRAKRSTLHESTAGEILEKEKMGPIKIKIWFPTHCLQDAVFKGIFV